MKPNLRQRNVALNSYMSILAVTIVGAFASFYILHVAQDVPLKTFATASTYEIGPSL